MYDKIEDDLIEAAKKLEMCRGKDVEGLVRPTTDRTRFALALEVIAAVIAALRQVVAAQGAGQPAAPGRVEPDGSGA